MKYREQDLIAGGRQTTSALREQQNQRPKGTVPGGYRVSAFCRQCGRDFAADTYFDSHRVGVHAYRHVEGLSLDPPADDGRRCLDDDELEARGLRRMSEGEMLASSRHRHRAGFGVPLWFDPAAAERQSAAHARPDTQTVVSASRNAREATRGAWPSHDMSERSAARATVRRIAAAGRRR